MNPTWIKVLSLAELVLRFFVQFFLSAVFTPVLITAGIYSLIIIDIKKKVSSIRTPMLIQGRLERTETNLHSKFEIVIFD